MVEVNVPKLLFSLGLLSYIVWWFYALFTTIVPWLDITIGSVLTLTLLQIVAITLFLTVGIVALVVCLVVLVALYW